MKKSRFSVPPNNPDNLPSPGKIKDIFKDVFK